MDIIWVMDSDICEMCDGLLDYFGICPHCGWDGVDWEEEDEIDLDPYNIDFDEQGRYIGG